jgi:hypothetical protein
MQLHCRLNKVRYQPLFADSGGFSWQHGGCCEGPASFISTFSVPPPLKHFWVGRFAFTKWSVVLSLTGVTRCENDCERIGGVKADRVVTRAGFNGAPSDANREVTLPAGVLTPAITELHINSLPSAGHPCNIRIGGGSGRQCLMKHWADGMSVVGTSPKLVCQTYHLSGPINDPKNSRFVGRSGACRVLNCHVHLQVRMVPLLRRALKLDRTGLRGPILKIAEG